MFRTSGGLARRRAEVFVAAAVVASLALWGLAPEARGQQTPQQADEDPGGLPYAAGELLVTYKSPGPSSREATRVLPERSRGEVEEDLPAVDAQLLAFPEVKDEASGEEREELLARKKRELEADPAVEAVDYNYYRRASFTPDDPLFSRQYGLSKIQAPAAWNVVRGDAETRIAIVDTGIDNGHPEFRGRIVAQREFVGSVASPAAQDRAGHGTAVSGVAAAVTDNGRGVAGTCPNCALMAAKVGNSLSGITVADEVQGINWAVDTGTDVINISLGGPGYVESEARAINRAWNSGVVVVAAAGNADSSRVDYPAGYGNVISVSATDRKDRRADFSNYGKTVDVAAPGVDIRTTDIQGGGGFSPSAYTSISGTSFSGPFVAGLAGLLASQGLSQDEIRERIEDTADDLGTRGKDRTFGFGRVNAARAVGAEVSQPGGSAPTISKTSPEPGSSTRNRTPTISAVVRVGGTGPKKSNLSMFLDGRATAFDYDQATGKVSFTPRDDLSRGKHSVEVTVRGDSGRKATERWTFEVTVKRGGGGSASAWTLDDADNLLRRIWPFTAGTFVKF